jgi:subtilisin family serine protease
MFIPSRARRAAAVAALGLASTVVPPLPAHADDAVAARYIVLLKPGRAGTASAYGLAEATVTKRYASISGFAATMTARAARQLAADPDVQLVEPDRRIGVTATQRNPDWGLDRIDQRRRTPSGTFTPTDDGSSVHAYVIDTGVRISHRQFRGRASYGYDFVGRDRTAGDCNGHGTHVAGTIGGATSGVAKRVRIVAVRVLDCDGRGWMSDIMDGVDWVTRHAIRPAVANMSLGGDNDPALDQAVARSIASGVTYTVAAGNDSVNAARQSPADVASAITVGATDVFDRRASFSNYGRLVDLFAPGVDITSAWRSSDTATAVESGTSMAAPHVAGAAALVLDAHPGWSPARVRDYLVAHATTGRVTNPGSGSPNRLLYTVAPPARPVIATGRLRTGTVGRRYHVQLSLRHSRRGWWRVTSGRLPRGLRLSASGVLSGSPRAAAVRRITIRFTDYVPQAVTRTFRLRVTRR